LLKAKVYPAKAYFDVFKSYSTNEYAIDYIAPAAYILACFSKPNDDITPEDLKLPGIK
jgi:endoglucanase